jgi:FtsH-binding integral membrane protein
MYGWDFSVGRESVGAAMLRLIENFLLCLLIAGAFFGGMALFWIARQDDSRLGRILGVLCTLVAILIGVYLVLGDRWL